jgi:outer membrane protein
VKPVSAARAALLILANPLLHAQGSEPAPTFKLGYAAIRFNTESGDLRGPPGTTPPGVQAGIADAATLALTYAHPLGGRWSLLAQAGTPPAVTFNGAGSAAALGAVGSARAWFPALLLQGEIGRLGPVATYGAFGVNHTFYTQRRVTDAYTAAFGGSSSRAELKSSWGGVIKLGAEWPLGPGWVADLAWSRYAIRTTATLTTTTPGLGEVARQVDVKADPDVFSLMLGRRF